MVLSGEARRAKQIVKIISSDGKIVYAKPHYSMVWVYGVLTLLGHILSILYLAWTVF